MSLSDSFLTEKILLNLKQGKPNSLLDLLFHSNSFVVVEVLYRCRDNLQLGQRFIDLIASNWPNFKLSQ